MIQLISIPLTLVISFFATLLVSDHLFGYLIPKPENHLEVDLGEMNREIDDYFGNSLFLKFETFKISNSLSDEQKVGMLLMPALERQNSTADVSQWIDLYNIGGFMVLKSDFDKNEIFELKVEGQRASGLPLFVSIDAEPSLIKYRAENLDGIINTDQIKSTETSTEQARIISEFLNQNGINLNFAPVYDNDQNKEVIGNRSFGGSDSNIQTLGNVFSEISKDENILTTAKHFPGHGMVSGDSHKSLPVIKENLTEIPNFKSAIENHIPFMMIGHLAVNSSNEKIDTSGRPATLSRNIITGLLIEELGFEGLIITDAMNMQALDNFDEIYVQSLFAGSDILLMPRDLELAFSQILRKMKESEDFRKIVNQKVNKIVRMKLVLKYLK